MILKRVTALFLSALLLLSFPITSLAVATAAPTVAEYIFGTILSANGVSSSLSGIKAWLGTWDTYEDYMDKGSRGELGAYSQWLYDYSRSDRAESAREKALENIEAMTEWMQLDWSDVSGKRIDLKTGIVNGWVNGAIGTSEDIACSVQGYLKTFPSYGTSALGYAQAPPAVNDNIEEWEKPSGWGKSFLVTSEQGYFSYQRKTSWYFYPSDYDSRNTYYAYLDHYQTSTDKWYVMFRCISGVPQSIGKVFGVNVGVHVEVYNMNTGTKKTNDTVISTNAGSAMRISDVRNLPFPVFSSETAANAFVANKVLEGLANQTVVGLPVSGVNVSAQTLTPTVVSDGITLPDSSELAAKLLNELISSMDRISELEAVLKNSGFVIEWGDGGSIDIPDTGEGTDTETKTAIQKILAKVEALPATIQSMLNNAFDVGEADDNVNNMKLPVDITGKFPFCIPFDVIYLVKSMSAKSEVPRFELPFKIHYGDINYEYTFVVDLTQWDPAVQILRTMLDLLFIAGLVSNTRNLIRG